jgi:hypothetical protein
MTFRTRCSSELRERATIRRRIRCGQAWLCSSCASRRIRKTMFDDQIKLVGLSIDDAIPAGKTVTWRGELDYNQFMDADSYATPRRRS